MQVPKSLEVLTHHGALFAYLPLWLVLFILLRQFPLQIG